MVSGIGILLGGLIGTKSSIVGNLITRLSGGAVMVIMIGALLIAHSNWGIFFGERGSILFASEQLFLLLVGTYFAIKGIGKRSKTDYYRKKRKRITPKRFWTRDN